MADKINTNCLAIVGLLGCFECCQAVLGHCCGVLGGFQAVAMALLEDCQVVWVVVTMFREIGAQTLQNDTDTQLLEVC